MARLGYSSVSPIFLASASISSGDRPCAGVQGQGGCIKVQLAAGHRMGTGARQGARCFLLWWQGWQPWGVHRHPVSHDAHAPMHTPAAASAAPCLPHRRGNPSTGMPHILPRLPAPKRRPKAGEAGIYGPTRPAHTRLCNPSLPNPAAIPHADANRLHPRPTTQPLPHPTPAMPIDQPMHLEGV